MKHISNILNISKILLFLCALFIISFARADIYTATSIDEINNTLFELLEKRNPQKTLTIIPFEDIIIRPVNSEFYLKDEKFVSIISRIIKKAKLSKETYIQELILTEYKNEVSDPKIFDLFKNIQKYDAPFIVVTNNVSGSFNEIPYLEVWTWNYLFQKGIDLSKNPIGSKQIMFNKNRKKVKGTYPTFYRGLLSCNSDGEKNFSQNLIANLLILNLKLIPDIVYVIHQNESYIKSIEQQFKSIRNDIQIVGFVYKPELKKTQTVSLQKFSEFWNNLVDKLNLISRKEEQNKENPYEQ